MFRLFRSKDAPKPPSPTFQGRAEAVASPLTSFNSFAGDYGEILTCPVSAYLPLLNPQLEDLRHELGMDNADFDALVRPMVDRFLERVHLLPASETHHHSRIGGLATHALDVAVHAARASHNSVLDYGRTFSRDLELRAKRKRVWPLAIALTGLLHDLGKPLADQVVVSTEGEVWNPFREGLTDWAKARGIRSYTVQWRAGPRLQRHVPFTLMLVPTILGHEGLAHLTDCGRDVLEAMIVTLSGVGDDVIGLKDLVSEADQASTAGDRETMRLRWRESAVGGHPVVNRILEAAKALIAEGRWVPNAVGSPLWIGEGGVYLVWNAAVANIIQWLRESGRAGGLPADPDRLAEFMVDALVAKPQTMEDGTRSMLWAILGKDAAGRSTAPSDALYIPEPSSILPAGLTWQPCVIEVLDSEGQPRAPVVAPIAPPPPQGGTLPSLPPVAQSPQAAAAAPAPQGPQAPAGSIRDEPPSAPESAEHSPTNPPPAADPETAAVANETERCEDMSSTDTEESPSEPTSTASVPSTSDAPLGPPADTASNVVDRAQAPAPAPPAVDLGEPLPPGSAPLASAGALGVFLERVALAIAGGNRDVAFNVFHKAGLVCLRWPQTATAVEADAGALARAIRVNPQWLAPDANGKPLDVANRGITVTSTVKNSAWNSIIINPELSEAFMAIVPSRKKTAA